MNEIIVVGHRNPDTDSIVAAMSYVALQHALGRKNYVAGRLGSVSDETDRMLKRFHFEPPMFVKNVLTQVRDLDFATPPAMDPSVTMDRAWRAMDDQEYNTIPVVNADGTLYGVLSTRDIADYNMRSIDDPYIDGVPLFNILSVLEGRLLNDGCDYDRISGNLHIALPQSCENLDFNSKDIILLCGNQPDVIERALKLQVNAIILCQTDVNPEWLANAGDTCIISSPFDASRVVRLLYQSVPISRPCQRENISSFHLNDYIDDVQEVVLKSRFRSYPVLDEDEKVVGMLSRNHLLRPRRKQVVLVDHNEKSQAVPGLDDAEILAIIDHHRLADIQTGRPITFRNEPLGSTTTIIALMYQENGVMPSPAMAGLMTSAILSDTVMFKSPTCTKIDIAMAERLARIGNVSIESIGHDLFDAGVNSTKSIDELVNSDFKEFHIAEHTMGVAQITCVDSENLLGRKDEFLKYMKKLQTERDYEVLILMLTDVLLEGTRLIYVGNEDIIRNGFSVEPADNTVFLPHVMSRKKQVIPALTGLWG